jgi:hypothetical protein
MVVSRKRRRAWARVSLRSVLHPPKLPGKVPADLVGLCFNYFSNLHIARECRNPSCCLRCREPGHRAQDCTRPQLFLGGHRRGRIRGARRWASLAPQRRLCTSSHPPHHRQGRASRRRAAHSPSPPQDPAPPSPPSTQPASPRWAPRRSCAELPEAMPPAAPSSTDVASQRRPSVAICVFPNLEEFSISIAQVRL